MTEPESEDQITVRRGGACCVAMDNGGGYLIRFESLENTGEQGSVDPLNTVRRMSLKPFQAFGKIIPAFALGRLLAAFVL